MSVIIGIPIKNDLESFKETIKSIDESTNFPHTLVLLDGGSTDGSAEYCDYLEQTRNNVEVFHMNTKGPMEAYNILFKLALEKESDLVLSQTDVIYPKLYKRDWLKLLHDACKQKDAGASTCLNGGGISGDTYLDGFRWIGGWCSYIPYSTINHVKGFDENYLIGDGADIDLTYAIVKMGLKIYYCNFWVDHHMQNNRSLEGQQSKEQLDKIKNKNAEYFRKKWQIK